MQTFNKSIIEQDFMTDEPNKLTFDHLFSGNVSNIHLMIKIKNIVYIFNNDDLFQIIIKIRVCKILLRLSHI